MVYFANISVGIYCYGTHLVTTVDIIGIIVKKDVRDKLILYSGKCDAFLYLHDSIFISNTKI